MNVIEMLIPTEHPNRPGAPLTPHGITWHRTGKDLGSIWLAGYFARQPAEAIVEKNTYGSSHVGIGDEGIVQYIPETEVAYHVAGDPPTYASGQNHRRLGVELCQYFQVPPRISPKTYASAVEYGVAKCLEHGWAGPREIAPEDGLPRFTRHSDHQANRPSDPGEFLRWDDFLDDVEEALLTGEMWKQGKVGATVEQALLEVVGKLTGLATSIVVWLARLQRGLDIERGTKFDPNVPPIDPRVVVK